MKKAILPAIFKWRQTEPELIICAVRWVQRYGPELVERLRRHLQPTYKSWRVDETYVRVKGRWCYLYRAIDSTGATIDFVLSGLRNAATGLFAGGGEILR